MNRVNWDTLTAPMKAAVLGKLVTSHEDGPGYPFHPALGTHSLQRAVLRLI
jgi:hypothetical protein